MRKTLPLLLLTLLAATGCDRVDCTDPFIEALPGNLNTEVVIADYYPSGDGFRHRSHGIVTGSRYPNLNSGDTVAFNRTYFGLGPGEDCILRFPESGKEFRFSDVRLSDDSYHYSGFLSGEPEPCFNTATITVDGATKKYYCDGQGKISIVLGP